MTVRARRWRDARPWGGTVARLIVGVVFGVAGGSKVTDLAASGRAVNAYQLLPVALGRVVGAALPLVELALGVMLLAGLATRLAAGVASTLLTVFVGGIASVWARGLRIDCGCFGGGGELGASVRPTYGWEITRDVALLALAVFVLVYPRTRLSVDGRLLEPPEDEQ